MLVWPAIFKIPMARLRKVAMTSGPGCAGGYRDVPPGQVLDLGVQAALVPPDTT